MRRACSSRLRTFARLNGSRYLCGSSIDATPYNADCLNHRVTEVTDQAEELLSEDKIICLLCALCDSVVPYLLHFSLGSRGIRSASRLTMSSGLIPSASALKFVMIRCRSTGGATA